MPNHTWNTIYPSRWQSSETLMDSARSTATENSDVYWTSQGFYIESDTEAAESRAWLDHMLGKAQSPPTTPRESPSSTSSCHVSFSTIESMEVWPPASSIKRWLVEPSSGGLSSRAKLWCHITRNKQALAAAKEVFSSSRRYTCPHMSREDEDMCAHWKTTVEEVVGGKKRFAKGKGCKCAERRRGMVERMQGWCKGLLGERETPVVLYPVTKRKDID